jgi:AcrR family transcriptional regulator
MDPRIARTRRSLQLAMLGLARMRDLEQITVADVVEHAEVTRSSFYLHYDGKETLLADGIDLLMDESGADLGELIAMLDDPPQALAAFLRHFEEHAELYGRVLGPHGSSVVIERLRLRVEGLAAEALGSVDTVAFEGVPVDIAAAGLVGSVLGVIAAWIRLEPRPDAEVAAQWIWRILIGPGGAWERGERV